VGVLSLLVASTWWWRPHHWLVIHVGDWPAWITAVSTLLTMLVLGITAIFVLRGIEDARKTRHGQLASDMARRWDEPDVLRAAMLQRDMGPEGIVALIEDLWAPNVEHQEHANLARWYELSVWVNVIETLGVFYDRGVITEDIIYKLWSTGIITAWETWRDGVSLLRKYEGRETFRYFETLANRMLELAGSEPIHRSPPPTKSEARAGSSDIGRRLLMLVVSLAALGWLLRQTRRS
jgi:hypothetical protein